jgi:hypothetical protein
MVILRLQLNLALGRAYTMGSSSLVLAGLVGAGCVFVLARRSARRWQQQTAAAAALDTAERFASFQAALTLLGVSDRVSCVVYDYFATRERVTGLGYPPRAGDRLWEDHLIAYPDELATVLGGLLVRLGCSSDVPPPAEGELRTMSDLALWLEREARDRARPA